jgi:hypothetical protein
MAEDQYYYSIAKQIMHQIYVDDYKGQLDKKKRIIVNSLAKKIKDLDAMKAHVVMEKNTLNTYTKKTGWTEYLIARSDDLSNVDDVDFYDNLFNLSVEILEVIREQKELEKNIIIYSIDKKKGGQIKNIYESNESDLQKNIETVKTEKNVLKDYLKYKVPNSITTPEVKKSNGFEAFNNHFKNFYRIATSEEGFKERYSPDEVTESGKKKRGKYNVGHITEAYQNHLVWKDNFLAKGKENLGLLIENFVDDQSSTHMDKESVAINLYYSINSDPWFSGGDVVFYQIKANNRKLASINSIKAVASRILSWIQNPQELSEEEFNKTFRQKASGIDPIEGLKEDMNSLTDKTLDELLNMIGNKAKQLSDDDDDD